MRGRWAFVLGFTFSAAVAWAQTHTVLTTDQSFLTSNGHPLDGTYQCRNGVISDCTISGATLTNATLTSPTLTNPTITGTVAGGASYTGITLTNPTITGTVAGGATYTSITLTTPVIGGTTITALSGNSGVLGTVSGSLGQNALKADASGNIVSAGESARTFINTATTGTTAATAGTQYMPVVGVGVGTTESNLTQIGPAQAILGIGCGTATAVPGVGASWTMSIRNGKTLADCGSFSCVISGLNNSCAIPIGTNTCVLANGDSDDIQIVPSGGTAPTASAITCFTQGVRTG